MLLVDRYEIVRPIKSGGMGAVYLAKDHRLGGSPCAVKAMLEACKNGENSEIILRKFQSESVVLGHLQHPGIPRVRDYFIDGNTAYIVMDFIEGENLEHELTEALADTKKPLDIDWAVQACLEVLDILIHLHGLPTPVIHCDIKPANLIREAKSQKVMLVDFGLARSLESAKTQTVAGTLGYSALEQLQGHAEPRSDLYSVGVTLYHMLTGKAPAFLQVPPVRELRADLDPRLAAVVDHATKLDIDERIGTAVDMRRQLQDWLENRHQQPSQADLDRAARLAAAPPAVGPPTPGGSTWQRIQTLMLPSPVTLPSHPAAFSEPCPACFQTVSSTHKSCGQCGQQLDPDPLQIGSAMRQSALLVLTNKPTALAIFVLCLVLQVSIRFIPRLVSFWSWPLLAVCAALAILLQGFMQSIAASRSRTGVGLMPQWTDILSLGRAGWQVFCLSVLMLILPSSPLLLVAAGLAKFAGNGETSVGVFLVQLVNGVLLGVLLVRQILCFPWSWAGLSKRVHLTTAVDTGNYAFLAGAAYGPHGLFWLANLFACAALCGLLNALPWFWPLASVAACWSVVTLADFMAAIYRSRFARKLPSWPTSFRAAFGDGKFGQPSPPKPAQPGLYLIPAAGFAVCLLFGAVLPSRDPHRFPMPGLNGKVGLINRNGWMSIPPRFNGAKPFVAPEAGPVQLSDKWGYLKANGTWLVEPRFQAAHSFSVEGLAAVLTDQGWGFLDRSGQVAIAPQFDMVYDFKDGAAYASKSRDLWGQIDTRGNWTVEPNVSVQPPSKDPFLYHPGEHPGGDSDLTLVRGEGLVYFQNQSKQKLAQLDFDRAEPFSQGLALVLRERTLGYIDRKGHFVYSIKLSQKQPVDDYWDLTIATQPATAGGFRGRR